jgi:3-oxoacyl-[acyl-carrier protein] reductase
MPLRDRTALVTGGGRRGGIGHATACRLAAYGAAVVVHHFAPHDATQEWGADDVDAALAEVRGHATAPVAGVHADLADPAAPQRLLDDTRPGGAAVLLTSGQARGPMPGEVAYAAAKAAVAGITPTLADQLADRRLRVNTVNPGPVDTGYLGAQAFRAMAPMFPFGRFGEPDDPARLIAWLCTDEAAWITGQVIDSEGGFARHRNGWRPW